MVWGSPRAMAVAVGNSMEALGGRETITRRKEMVRRVITFIGAFFLGVFVAYLPSVKDQLGSQAVYQWLSLALAVLLFIAAAFVGRVVKKETAEA